MVPDATDVQGKDCIEIRAILNQDPLAVRPLLEGSVLYQVGVQAAKGAIGMYIRIQLLGFVHGGTGGGGTRIIKQPSAKSGDASRGRSISPRTY